MIEEAGSRTRFPSDDADIIRITVGAGMITCGRNGQVLEITR